MNYLNIYNPIIHERNDVACLRHAFYGVDVVSPHCENLGFSCMGLLRLSLSEAFAPSGRNN